MITLRPITEFDTQNLLILLNNPNVSKYMSDLVPFPYTIGNVNAFLELVKNSTKDHFFAIDLNSHMIGGLGLHYQSLNHCKNTELVYWLGEPYWGHGYASIAIKLAVDYAFSFPDIHKIFAKVYSGNIASEKALLKTGFVLEGVLNQHVFKNGKYLDEKIYGVIRK